MQSSTMTLAVADGVSLHVHRWLPDRPAKAVVQIVHGLAEHGTRYGRLAQALTDAGYAIYADDHRGHGRTASSPAELGFFAVRDGWRKCLDDLWQLNRRLAADHPGLPIILFGHSLGASMGQDFIAEHGEALAGIVLSGSSGKPAPIASLGRLVARIERARLGAHGHSTLLYALTFGAFNKSFAPARTPFDWLSRDPAEVDKYIADPFCGFALTTQIWIDVLDAFAAAADPRRLARIPKQLPIHFIAGSRDPVGGNTRAIERLVAAYRRAGLERVTQRFYPDARHELVNETNRDEVTRDLIAWLDELPRR